MNEAARAQAFCVINAAAVTDVLNSSADHVMNLVAHAYRLHGQGDTVNPPSTFLRLTEPPGSRIIALPSAVDGDVQSVGVKWIASFPGNLAVDLPRASAVIILNDPRTGFPTACVESSIISATRTAASAVLAATRLAGSRSRMRVGFVGTGLIAGYVQRYLMVRGWSQRSSVLYDADPARATRFAQRLTRAGHASVRVCESADEVVRNADLIVFATTASTPYLLEPELFEHGPLVLHLSLRDLGPKVILNSINVVDDRDHCLRERTSTHLAAAEAGHQRFLTATIPEVLAGAYVPPPETTVIVSPFGLGVLDIVLADFVYTESLARGAAQMVPGFFDAAGAEAPLPDSLNRQVS